MRGLGVQSADDARMKTSASTLACVLFFSMTTVAAFGCSSEEQAQAADAGATDAKVDAPKLVETGKACSSVHTCCNSRPGDFAAVPTCVDGVAFCPADIPYFVLNADCTLKGLIESDAGVDADADATPLAPDASDAASDVVDGG